MKFFLYLLLVISTLSLQACPEATANPQIREADNKAFLEAHNTRRKKYHEGYGVPYVPLKHSTGLEAQSRKWARHLVKKVCSGQGSIYHDPSNKYGENIASNKGSGSWGKKPLADNILNRFVEKEMNKMNKGHLTQALWRPTKYVGCAIAAATSSSNPKVKCHVTVCRYAKPGNCNMGKYSHWQIATYQDDSPCGPKCPPEGC